MSTRTLTDPKVIQLGERHGPVGPLLWTALLCHAGAQEKKGKVQLAFRTLAFELFSEVDTVNSVLDTAIEIGLCHTVSRDVHGFEVELPRWERYQATGRKARERERKKGLKQADVTPGHTVSRDVTTDRQTDKTENSSNSAPASDPGPYGSIVAKLDTVAFARNKTVAVDAVTTVCDEFSHLDLEAEVAKFAHYWTEGPKAKEPMDDVVWRWRGWLERAKEKPTGNPRSTVGDDLKRLEREHAAALAEEARA
jgi:hypothetical protein